MDDFKQLTEQLLKFYIDTESIDDTGFENFFDDNSSIIGTGKHEFFRNLHEFQESYKFDVKRREKDQTSNKGLTAGRNRAWRCPGPCVWNGSFYRFI